MKTKKFKRSEFDEYISNYSIMNLLNCLCAITDKLLPHNKTLMIDFVALSKVFKGLIRQKLKQTTHFPENTITNDINLPNHPT